MLAHSNSFVRLKAQVQHAIDFSVLVCHAVPSLKGYMKAVEGQSAPKLPTTDFFGKTMPHDELRAFSTHYRKTLGRFILLSSFSYFEAYCKSLLEEIVAFHGGLSRFETRVEYCPTDKDVIRRKRKLQEPLKPGAIDKYRKVARQLRDDRLVFPSERLATFAVREILRRSETMRASQIPEVLDQALGLVLSAEEHSTFTRIRERRNDVAHGDDDVVIELSEAIDDNDALRLLAVRIDAWVVDRFFMVEPHA